MKRISRNQAVAVGVALVATFVILFFGSYVFQGASAPTATTQGAPADQTLAAPATISTQDLTVGIGPVVKAGDVISIQYIGTLTDGTKFDSSYDRNQPLVFTVGTNQVILGMDQGVIGMQVGGKRKIIIPPSLGYGDQPVGPIPINSTLVFQVELVKIGK